VFPEFGGVVVDSKMSGDLIGSEPGSFEVESGQHSIKVITRRRPVIYSSRRWRVTSMSVTIEAGPSLKEESDEVLLSAIGSPYYIERAVTAPSIKPERLEV
jgi:hypothetical protein